MMKPVKQALFWYQERYGTKQQQKLSSKRVTMFTDFKRLLGKLPFWTINQVTKVIFVNISGWHS